MMSDFQYRTTSYPLHTLAQKLMVGPPLLKDIISQLRDGEMMAEFLSLVREYLPEKEVDILEAPNEDRAGHFAGYFEEKYFPLYAEMFMDGDDAAEMYLQLLNNIPIMRMGFTFDDYHDLENLRPGFVMLMCLVNCPFGFDEGDGALVPIRESTSEQCGKNVVRRIPESGWDAERLEEWLKGTEYACVGMFGQWLHRETGSPWLDMSYEDEGYGDLQWERELVDYMTEQWPKTDKFLGEIGELAAKLESDPKLLTKIVNSIEERQGQLKFELDHPKTLVEIFNDN